MCGICGVITKTYQKTSKPAIECTQGMLQRLQHRGPDSQGICSLIGLHDAAFGHTRLSILDLSVNGNQPMFNEERSLVLVANGEIYNYQDLRQKLRAKQHHFISTSDSEVILHAYEEYGVDAFSRLRGMYAFALYDVKKQSIMLKRDPLGIKPLYFCETEDFIAFSSEIRALLTLPIDREFDSEAISEFLLMGCISAPLTHIKAVHALLPGQLATIQNGQLSFSQGSAIEDYILTAAGMPYPEPDHIRDCLRDSTRMHLISDAPIGLFLSGGIDSGTLAGLSTETGHTNIQGVCVTVPGHKMDESRYARMTAKRYGICMHEIPLTQRIFEQSMEQFMLHIDMPTCDGFNTFVVARAAREAGFKAAISGVGGDELFAGYPTFQWVPFFMRFCRTINAFGSLSTDASAKLLRFVNHSSAAARISRLIEKYPAERRISYLAYRGMFVTDLLTKLFRPTSTQMAEETLERFLEQTAWVANKKLNTPLAVAGLEIERYMQPMLLRDADNFSMAHSLEVRTPLVDESVLRTCLPALAHWRQQPDRYPKLQLRQTLQCPLPTSVVVRKKQGFTFPWQQWMRGKVMEELNVLTEEDHPLRNIISFSAIQSIMTEFQQGNVHWRCVWSLYVLLKITERDVIQPLQKMKYPALPLP